jgi:NADH-quinone oxidoreductase subunit J
MSTAGFVLFLVCAVVSVLGAIGTVAARRPLRAAVSLLVTIIAIAGLYLGLSAQLLAAIQLLVYAGAVVVLFIFVIMLIGPSSEGSNDGAAGGRHLMVRMLSLAGMGMFTATLAFTLVDVSAGYLAAPEGFGSTKVVGEALYRQSLVPFEVVSITLLVAIVGALAVARTKTAKELSEARERRTQIEKAA